MEKILVAVDGSEASTRAAQLALRLATETGATLTAACAITPRLIPSDVPFAVVHQVAASEVQHAKAVLSAVRLALGDPAMSLVELQGGAAESIARLAEEGGYDLVVVGSRGLNAVARVFLGSVADRLVHICRKAVLVAR